VGQKRERSALRRTFTWTVLGALTGVAVATLFAPMILRTLLASTGASDAMCQCLELVNNTSMLLIKSQLWGLVIGAVAFPTGAGLARWLWGRRKRRAAEARVQAAQQVPDRGADTVQGP
jgi:hypothetical protein